MQAYAERLTGGLNAARIAADATMRASHWYWRTVTRYVEPIGAAYGTVMAGASMVFVLYCALS
jgi:hypothetical protein